MFRRISGLECSERVQAFQGLDFYTCKTFPKEEQFRLIDQLKRASRSITANIAEGYGRYHYQENTQFCRQARGSLMECLDHLICAADELYISKEQLDVLEKEYQKIVKLLNDYFSFLQEKKSKT
ncbi:MAG: four helix bundle protein [Bacteroidota bacterium]